MALNEVASSLDAPCSSQTASSPVLSDCLTRYKFKGAGAGELQTLSLRQWPAQPRSPRGASSAHLAFSGLPAPPQRSGVRIAGGEVGSSGLIMHVVRFPAVACVAGGAL